MTSSPCLSDDERLLDLVRLIGTRHPSALTAVRDTFEDAPYLATTTLSFLYRETGVRNEHECCCHYDHEYMTYLTESGFDHEKFGHVAKNVVRGLCRHAKSDPYRESLGQCSTDSELSLQSLLTDNENNVFTQTRRLPRVPSVSLAYETDEIIDNSHAKVGRQYSDDSVRSFDFEENRSNRVRFSISGDSPYGSLSSLSEIPDSDKPPVAKTRQKPPYFRQSSTGSLLSSTSDRVDIFKKSRLWKRRSSTDFDVRVHPRLARRRSSASLRLMDIEIEDIKMSTETSLIHVAAAVGDGSMVSFLLKKAKSSLEQLGAFQLSPLHLAIVKNKMCYLKQIMLQPDTFLVNKSGMFKFAERPVDKHGHRLRLVSSKLSLIGLCIKMNDTGTLLDLLKAGIFSDSALERGLKEAVENDSSEPTEILLQMGIRPNLDVMKEGTSKSADVFESLFRRFRKDFKIYCIKQPETVIRDLLMPSILTKNIEVVRILVQNGVPLNQTKGFYSPVTCAVLDNQPEILRLVLEGSADKAAEMQGYTLLDISCCMGFKACADVLKRHGVKKTRNIKNSVPLNLLMGIAGKLNSASDQVKLHRQLEHKRHSSDGDTVLHVAIKSKLSLSLVREILSLGSDINAKNKRQETPLMLAVSKEICAPLAIIREILYFNPILEQTDKSSKTTLNHAMSRDFMVRSLVSKNGNMADSSESAASLLFECGYNLKYDDSKKSNNSVYALKTVWKDLAVTMGCGRDINLRYRPKSLQERCREALRRAYLGIQLHKFLRFMKVPSDISDYVLFTELLGVETDNYT